MVENNFRDEEIVKVQGRQYPIVGGRLRLAHEENNELSITSNIIEMNEDRIIVQANIRTLKGNFSGLGNASPKRDRMLSNALIELAETRAIARALRFAGYGVEYTGYEEMPENVKENAESNKNDLLASKSQLEAIASIAKSNNISSQQLRDIMYNVTGKTKSLELTIEDASNLISGLKKAIDEKENTKIS